MSRVPLFFSLVSSAFLLAPAVLGQRDGAPLGGNEATLAGTLLQQAYLKASNNAPGAPGGTGDSFGFRVAVSGDTVVVGASNEDSSATGVNGDGSTDFLSGAGAAYVFVRDGTAWSEQAYLKSSSTDAMDGFGLQVAISGDTIVAGAVFEDSSATGVDGDGSDNGATGSGAAYVFARSGTVWSPEAYLKASNTEAGDQFATQVAVAGDTIVVSAKSESSSATGVNGDQSDNHGQFSGAAYVFVRSGTTWTQEAYLKASNTDRLDLFGTSVAISGDTIVVGTRGEDSAATGVDGDESDNSAEDAGAAYVFVRSGTTWTQEAYLKASNTDAGDAFGANVAIWGDTVAVAASGEESGATGVDGDQADDSAPGSGAVYVFVRTGTTWSQEAYLKASNTDPGDLFVSVALGEDVLVAGAPLEDSAATGVDGDGSDNGSADSGAAYLFARSGSSWSQAAYLKASNTDPTDGFAKSVAVSGDTVVAGASLEASGANAVNGDQQDDSLFGAGAAYVFDTSPLPSTYCTGKVTSEGCTPVIGLSGVPGSGFSIDALLVVQQKNGLLFYGLAGPAALPFQGGTLCVQPPLRRTPIQNSGGSFPCGGILTFDFDAWFASGVDSLLGAGSQVNAQYWFRDPADALGVGLSNAVQFVAE